MSDEAPPPRSVLLRRLDEVLRRDPGGRCTDGFFLPGQLGAAARSLLAGRRVVLTSGFLVPFGPPERPLLPETDGPPGARALGDALVSCGIGVRYVSGPACAPVFRALGAEPLDVLRLPPGAGARRGAAAYLAEHTPTHLVAIERPGRARDGEYRSMRGRAVSAPDHTLDELFLVARAEPARGIETIGIGDGGNEIGMGRLAGEVARSVPHGEEIASVVETDWVIVAGVSTWGAYALVGALSLHAGRDLLPTAAEAAEHVRRIVAAGAVDGVTGRPAATIDGLPLEATLDVLEEVRRVIEPATGLSPGGVMP